MRALGLCGCVHIFPARQYFSHIIKSKPKFDNDCESYFSECIVRVLLGYSIYAGS